MACSLFDLPIRKAASRLTLLIAIALGACSDASGPDDPFPVWPSPEYREIYGGGLRLSVFEAPGPVQADTAGRWSWTGVEGEPRILLALKTLRDWECAGRLEADSEVSATAVTVEVKRVFPGLGPCLVSASPAVFVLPLPLEPGEYSLRLLALGETHEFKLRIGGAAIDLVRVGPTLSAAVLGENLVRAEFTTFWRFPSRSMAFHCGPPAAPPVCDEVARDLVGRLGMIPNLFGPDGHLPFPQSPPDNPMGVRYLLYQRDEDFDLAADLVCAAWKRTGVPMFLWSWRNEVAPGVECAPR